MQDVRSAHESARVGLHTRGPGEQTRLDAVGAEDPLHGYIAEYERAYEGPVARRVEQGDSLHGCSRFEHAARAELVERIEAAAAHRATLAVDQEKKQIGIASTAMAAVSTVTSAMARRQIADHQRCAARQLLRDLARCILEQLPKQRGAPARVLARPRPHIARSVLWQRDGCVQRTAVRGADARCVARVRCEAARREREEQENRGSASAHYGVVSP
jgi:hypothetical protein